MQMNERDSLVLTPLETAKLLRIGRGTVYEQIRVGVIPSIRMGRRILIPRAALMKMLETARVDSSRSQKASASAGRLRAELRGDKHWTL